MVTTRVNKTNKFTKGNGGRDIIGLHTAEAPEQPNTAENVANYFKNSQVKASAHWCCDNNSRVRGVDDSNTAWTLPGANYRSLNIEMAGYAKQTAADWKDQYSLDMLEIVALTSAEWCIKYGIPARKLTDAQIRNGEKGFAGHVDVNRVYKKSTHWDPGPHFPWTYFLGRVKVYISKLKGQVPSVPKPPTATFDNKGYSTAYIKQQQRKLQKLGYKLDADGFRGPATIKVVKEYQTKKKLQVDGIPGPATSKSLDADIAKLKPKKDDIRGLQRVIKAAPDNMWGLDTERRFNTIREASQWGGYDFPYGVGYAQDLVGTKKDWSWGPASKKALIAKVKQVQKELADLGYDPGKIDGHWGTNTERAYQQARKVNRL